MYDHNQTLVPESFLALHVRHGRPLLKRKELEARYESAEALAEQIAAVLANIPADDPAGQRDALLAVKSSLLADLLREREAEATWVVTRAAELCEWALPDLVETGIRFDSKTRSAP
jgi:hypothetical protein